MESIGSKAGVAGGDTGPVKELRTKITGTESKSILGIKATICDNELHMTELPLSM